MPDAANDPGGFRSLERGLAFGWNSPFGKVRDELKAREARDLEEQGMRLLRFEETVRGDLDFQYELVFSPDYGYGLRAATATLEKIGGRTHFKDASGSFRPFVQAYLRMLELLGAAHGEPVWLSAVTASDPELLIRTLDHTREHASILASWSFPASQLSCELLISFTPRCMARFSPIHSKLRLVNDTGRPDLAVDVEFPGGSAQSTLGRGQDRVVELPTRGDFKVQVSQRRSSARIAAPIGFDQLTLSVRRGWLTGRLSIVATDR